MVATFAILSPPFFKCAYFRAGGRASALLAASFGLIRGSPCENKVQERRRGRGRREEALNNSGATGLGGRLAAALGLHNKETEEEGEDERVRSARAGD